MPGRIVQELQGEEEGELETPGSAGRQAAWGPGAAGVDGSFPQDKADGARSSPSLQGGTGALGPSAPHNLLHSTAVSPPQKNGIAAALTRLQEENLGFKSPKLKSSNPEPFGF